MFGRIAPEQKERLVESLRRQGRYVAMIGDGVNDARALKRAHVGVAMKSGSAVARDVADIVLTDDSLAALRPAQHEGRRIIDGIGTSMQVFLARVGTQGLVILAVTMLGLGFPYSPANVGLTLLTVGVPTLFLTAWARPTRAGPAPAGEPGAVRRPGRGDHGRRPASAVYAYHYTFLLEGLEHRPTTPAEVLADFESYTGLSSDDVGFAEAAATIGAQTALSTFVSYAAFLLILFLKPPTRFFAAWTRPDGDRRPAVLVVVLVVVFSGAAVRALVLRLLRAHRGRGPGVPHRAPGAGALVRRADWAYRSACSSARSGSRPHRRGRVAEDLGPREPGGPSRSTTRAQAGVQAGVACPLDVTAHRPRRERPPAGCLPAGRLLGRRRPEHTHLPAGPRGRASTPPASADWSRDR